MLFQLIAGSHTSGTGVDAKIHRWDDPATNVVEDNLVDLAAEMPEKFDYYDGDRPRMRRGPNGQPIRRGEIPPPPTPRLERNRFVSAEAKRRRAEQLRKEAEALEDDASNQEEAASRDDDEDFENEATSHVREKFAASDAASEFEEEGRERAKRSEEAHRRSTARIRAAQRDAQRKLAEEGEAPEPAEPTEEEEQEEQEARDHMITRDEDAVEESVGDGEDEAPAPKRPTPKTSAPKPAARGGKTRK